jgi:hypothetical protein
VVACSKIAGLGDPVVVSPLEEDASVGDGNDGGSGGSAAACGSCAASECASPWDACRASTACSPYEDCLLACGGDYACRSGCLVSRYTNAPEIPALDQCVAARCSEACGLTCATPSVYTEPDAAVACQQCLNTSACAPATACSSDLACEQITQCTLGCATQDCFLACGTAPGDDAGLSDFVAYVASAERCAGPCGIGTFWDCASPAMPPISETGQTALTLSFVRFPDLDPLVGATVKACVRDDVPCANPVVAPGITDASGNVTFTLVTGGPFGFGGYFDVSSDGIYPSLYFLKDPLSVPSVTFPEILVPETSAVTGVAGLYASVGATPDPSRGVVELEVTDCHFSPASGAAVKLVDAEAGVEASTPFLYFVNGQLSTTATSTNGSGYAVLLDAPVGVPLTVSMTPPGGTHAMSTETLFARAGTWSYLLVRP